jgi:hypothetical protein
MWLLLLSIACSSPDDDDDDSGFLSGGDPPGEEEEECSHWLWANGTPIEEKNNPLVDEEWTVLLYCDNILELGPSVLRIDPATAATLDSELPLLTFRRSGDAVISMQVGQRKATADITVEN